MIISSKDNEKIKYLRKLREKKHIDEESKFIVEGLHLVEEALSTGSALEIILLENKDFKTALPTIYVTQKVLKSLSLLESSPDIMAVCKKIESKDIGKKIIILDNLQDPGNIGTIIRTAIAFDIDTVIFSPDTVSPYNDKLIRASQGMIFKINIIIKDIKEVITDLKNKNITVISSSLSAKKELKELPKLESYALILGNEGAGIKEELEHLSDEVIKINMNTKCESLNVGVSCGIILYHLR